MLLVELEINGTINRLSIEGHALDHYWDAKITDFETPMFGPSSDHGGFCKMEFGSIAFVPDLFDNDWPPPVSCPISIYYSDSTEAAKELIFFGTAHLQDINRESISYDLYGPDYDETIADGTIYNDTLNNVITSILTSIAEISTVNTTYARATSPNVSHTVDGDQIAIDLAGAIAEFYSHLIYVVGSTAYLVDMKLDNGSRTITEFDFFGDPAPEYWHKVPVAIARSGDYSRTSSYPYGDELTVDQYHDTQTNVEAALDDIIAIENKVRATIAIPFIGNIPAPGEKISWVDTSQTQDMAAWIRARVFRYNFVDEYVLIEGEGEVSVA